MELSQLTKAEESLRACMEEFDLRVQRTLERTLKAPMPPNSDWKVSVPKSLRKKQILLLSIASWQLSAISRSYLQWELRRHRHFDDFCRVALASREGSNAMLASSFSERDFYGNCLRCLVQLIGPVNLLFLQPPRPRTASRRRGHRESSSDASQVLAREYQNSHESREEQLKAEEKAIQLEDLYQSFWGWAEPRSSRLRI